MFACSSSALILALLLLAACARPVRIPSGAAAAPGCDLSAASQELAAEFVRLRTVQGHFQGGPWTAEVDDWMGRKHQVMIGLGTQLVDAGCTQGQVTDLLGPPDLTVTPGDPLFDQVSRQAEFEKPPAEPYTLLIYYWRGAHDFLYFTSVDGAIIGSGWWHAYE
jgi:hypothetical protein